MAALYTVRGWKNTGFDTGNVPGSAAALPKVESSIIDFNAVFIWQNKDLAEIRVEGAWDDVQDVDYIRIMKDNAAAYYVVTGITMLADATVQMAITLDPLLTAGGIEAISVLGGQVERAHAGTDTLFDNVIPEPWRPTDILQYRETQIVNQNDKLMANDPRQTLVLATGDLTNMAGLAAQIAVVENSADNGAVVWPKIPKPSSAVFRILDPEPDETDPTPNLGFTLLKGYGIYDGNAEVVQEGIAIARSLGIEGLILNAYEIPARLIQTGEDPGAQPPAEGNFDIVRGKSSKITSDIKFTYGYTPKNNKVYALYNTISLTSSASGDTKEFSAADLYSAGATNPAFYLVVDPSPNGTVYMQPALYQGARPPLLLYAVAGLPWYNAGVIFDGASGSSLAMANARRSQEMADVNRVAEVAAQEYNRDALNQRAIETIPGIAGAIGRTTRSLAAGDIGGAISSAFSPAGDLMALTRDYARQADEENLSTIRYRHEMGDRIFQTAVNTTVKAPQPAFPVSSNVSAMIGNAFIIAHIGLTDADMQRLDRFLTAYGYAQDKPFERYDLVNRTKFNYIKTTGAHVTAPNTPARILKQLEQMFDAGVRVWHETPSVTAYIENPAYGGDI